MNLAIFIAASSSNISAPAFLYSVMTSVYLALASSSTLSDQPPASITSVLTWPSSAPDSDTGRGEEQGNDGDEEGMVHSHLWCSIGRRTEEVTELVCSHDPLAHLTARSTEMDRGRGGGKRAEEEEERREREKEGGGRERGDEGSMIAIVRFSPPASHSGSLLSVLDSSMAVW